MPAVDRAVPAPQGFHLNRKAIASSSAAPCNQNPNRRRPRLWEPGLRGRRQAVASWSRASAEVQAPTQASLRTVTRECAACRQRKCAIDCPLPPLWQPHPTWGR